MFKNGQTYFKNLAVFTRNKKVKEVCSKYRLVWKVSAMNYNIFCKCAYMR